MFSAYAILAIAGVLLALATGFGAFGAHALNDYLSLHELAVYDTAVRYHFFNALGLLGIGLAARAVSGRLLQWSAMLILAGVLLFSGSLYVLSFGAPRAWGVVTPFGGLAFVAGWLLFAVAMMRARRL